MKIFLYAVLIYLVFTPPDILSQVPFAEWIKVYDGAGTGNNDGDNILSMYIDINNNVLLTGSTGRASNASLLLMKYDNVGNMSWVKNTGTSTYGHSVISDNYNNIFVSGYNNRFFYLFRYDSMGGSHGSASVIIGGSYPYTRESVLNIDKQNNIYISASYQYGFPETYSSIVIAKYDRQLNSIFYKSFGQQSYRNKAYDSGLDSAGNIYVTGRVFSSSNDKTAFCTLKYDSSGVLLWSKTYNGTGGEHDTSQVLTIDKQNNVVVSGTSTESSGFSAITTIKYDSVGNEIWKDNFAGPGNNKAVDIISDDSNNVIVTGQKWNGNNYDIVTIKYDSAGNTKWIKEYAGAGGLDDSPACILIDIYGCIYVGGTSVEDITKEYDYLVIKYDTEGKMVWNLNYNGPFNKSDMLRDMKFDLHKNLIITGLSNSHTDADIATIKYSSVVGINTHGIQLPEAFSLSQNYPNPFNPITNIKFDIPKSSFVTLRIYDLLGREIAVLVSENLKAGSYRYDWNGSSFASGVYFYKLEADDFIQTKKMLMLK